MTVRFSALFSWIFTFKEYADKALTWRHRTVVAHTDDVVSCCVVSYRRAYMWAWHVEGCSLYRTCQALSSHELQPTYLQVTTATIITSTANASSLMNTSCTNDHNRVFFFNFNTDYILLCSLRANPTWRCRGTVEDLTVNIERELNLFNF